MVSLDCKVNRIIVLKVNKGDDLLKSLEQCVDGNKIKSGFINLIGSLKEFNYGLYAEGKYKTIHKATDKHFEILTGSGNITRKEGKPFVHLHVVVANDYDGTAFGGHLMEGSIVDPLGEVVIYEVDKAIDRKYDAKTNLWPLDIN